MPHTPPQIVLVKVAVMVASSSEQTARNAPEGRPVQRGQIPGDMLLETGALEKGHTAARSRVGGHIQYRSNI